MTGIAKVRKQKGMRQAEIAERLNLHRSTVAKWETGAAAPRANMLPQLAKILDCTVDELLQTNDDE